MKTSPSYEAMMSPYSQLAPVLPDQNKKNAFTVERRREFEIEGKERIFDPKTLKLGINAFALQEQVLEKNEENSLLKLDQQQHDEHALYFNSVMKYQELLNMKKKNEIAQNCTDGLKGFSKHQNHEFDLGKKPMAFGPASMLKMEGEDPNFEGRLKIQKAQMKSWLQAQMQETAVIHNSEREMKNIWDKKMLEMDNLRCAVENSKQQFQKETLRNLAASNHKIADNNREREKQIKAAEESVNLSCITTNHRSPILSGRGFTPEQSDQKPGTSVENVGTATLGCPRVNYKGASKLAKQRNMEENEKLHIKRLQAVQNQRAEQKQWESHSEAARRMCWALERERKLQAKDRDRAIVQENQTIEQQQRTSRATFW